ncbi:hypothetical protein ABFS82_09G124600 [Erythranthe guttata]|uniref:Uncharacterized protein n=1 Tax=Erythranthe guttata TaxID=4155 RepID=A0A022QIZ1_ERYGU|nr:PREDICTED: uncharacterized protein LOC105970222 [Erythranthe guttata]EYU26445.1 hypothetical protein MIMGU_mgv1a015073mg [Erythranthe guttata]|eukprot:XP_012850484.1 PREDICTED: uncharacterized protein LOC105970222 [Erythranthe guttata]
MEENRWTAIREDTEVFLFYMSGARRELDQLSALQLQLNPMKKDTAIGETEIGSIEEAIDRQKSVCEYWQKKSDEKEAELHRKIEAFSTSKWVKILKPADLSAILTVRKNFPAKKLRFCLGRKARDVESIQRFAEELGIGVMTVGVLYELAEGKFDVVSEPECRALQFTY